MPFAIERKVALVTGGAKGIGLGIVNQLLKNGAKGIAVIDVNEVEGRKIVEDLCKSYGQNRCIFLQCNVAELGELEGAFERTVQTFKQLDIVINNAGIVDEKDYQKTLAVNLGGCVAGTKLAIDKYFPKYKSGDEGVILNISSVAGIQPLAELPIYSATKCGIIGLGRAYGAEKIYEQTNVKVLTVCPGATDTEIKPIDTPIVKVQPVDHVAKSVIDIIQNKKSGSVWVVNNSEPAYEEQFLVKSYIEMV